MGKIHHNNSRFSSIWNGYNTIIDRWVRPFFTKGKSKKVNPPYVYGFITLNLLFVSVYIFLKLAIDKYDSGILMAVSTVIGILAGLYYFIIQLYDKNKIETINENLGKIDA